MVLTPSTMIPLGTRAPPFSLPEPLTNTTVSFADVRGEQGTVVMFICNHCPYVKHVQTELIRIATAYAERGIGFVAISSNDADAYPDDSPERMAHDAERLGYPFPYLSDASQDIARAYHAACTPDFFVFDAHDLLVYRGQLDDTRPGSGPAHGADLRAALDALIERRPIPEEQKPSVGCTIKWTA